MSWIRQIKTGLFGDPNALKVARRQREEFRVARRRAEDRHLEDTQDILASSIRELLNAEGAAAEIEAAIRSTKDETDSKTPSTKRP